MLTIAAAVPATSTPATEMAVAILAFMVDVFSGVCLHGTETTSQRSPGLIQETSKIDPESTATGDDGGVQVLLVEDDEAIASSLVEALVGQGFEVRHVTTGAAAVAAEVCDVVLLDLGLPDMDGYDVCRQLRARSTVPIIVITARGEELDRVLGLELGADDYVVKPFGFRELVARIRAVTRRTHEAGASQSENGDLSEDVLVAGPLRVDRRTHRVTLDVDGDRTQLEFTPKEFEVLAYLAEDVGAVRTRTDIVEHVWDANWFGPTKTVDAHVAAIRRKLGDPGWIEAVRGVGFRLEVPHA